MSASTAKLAIVGYGKMGRLIEQLAPQHGLEVVLKLNRANNVDGIGIEADAFRSVDVAIEFSSPEAVLLNLQRLAALRIPVVTGTTGWFDQLPEIRQAFDRSGSGLVWSPNFSIGVAIFRRLTEVAAKLLSGESEYGAWAWEIHHHTKKDAPSGTLLQLIGAMEEAGYSRPISAASNRAGRHPGTHEIGFDSDADTLTLRHVARNRNGFAHGALRSARWIVGRSGVYTFDDVLFGDR